jgi:hypothetical protein
MPPRDSLTSCCRYDARGGKRPAPLLLHGFPHPHVCGKHIGPSLADRTVARPARLRRVVGADRRPCAEGYSKREMAGELVELLAKLGHERIAVAGHNRRPGRLPHGARTSRACDPRRAAQGRTHGRAIPADGAAVGHWLLAMAPARAASAVPRAHARRRPGRAVGICLRQLAEQPRCDRSREP